MKTKAPVFLTILASTLTFLGCGENRTLDSDNSDATVASETGARNLPPDVISVTKPLISGELYSRPSFEGTALTRFDTSQEIHVLDTTDVLFVRARIQKEEEEFTGFVSKAILPEE